MRVLFISKRSPQQRDLLARPYGRFFHLPVQLAQRGHSIAVSLCSHEGLASESLKRDGVIWASHDLLSRGPAGLLSSLVNDAREFRPDWIVGCSDAWYGWIAQYVARRIKARLAIDAYDNYEAYMPWNLPLHWTWRRAVHNADRVTVAGPQLASLLNRSREGKRPCDIVPMAADPSFTPGDRDSARAELGLPASAPLVGYFGGWAVNRGTDVLLEAFALVREHRRDVRLVLTGRPPAHALAQPGVISLGYMPDAEIPTALRALDVACVITSDSSFGRYSYPAKLCEAIACHIPVVATSTEPVRWMLANDPRYLVPVADAGALAVRIVEAFRYPPAAYPHPSSWGDSAEMLEVALTG